MLKKLGISKSEAIKIVEYGAIGFLVTGSIAGGLLLIRWGILAEVKDSLAIL